MITVLFGGSRPNGNTAQLTKFALQGLDYQWIDVTQHRFKPIQMSDILKKVSQTMKMTTRKF